MIIKNGIVLDKSFKFRNLDIKINQDKIFEIGTFSNNNENIIDANNKYVIPGLIDIHTHGCGGCDFCDGTQKALSTISEIQAKNGVTSFLGTSMTLSEQKLSEIFKTCKDFMQNQKKSEKQSNLLGINMEGPFLNIEKKGAQAGEHIVSPSVEMFERLNKASGNNIKLVCIAPEVENAIPFINQLSQQATISIAHTNATYDKAMEAIQNGASHITHLYNAMPTLTHRESGVIGACYDSNVMAELICDGIHISPPVVRSTFKTLGDDRVILISDSMCACGMPNGEYELGGQKVFVKDKKATLSDGTIAGSSTNLMDCMRKAVEFGISLEMAIKAATINPAKSINMDNKIGSIQVSKQADIVILNKDLTIYKVIINGNVI